MTAADKKEIAHFLDICSDTLHGGYRSGKKEYNFLDDATQSAEIQRPARPGNTDSLEQIAKEIKTCTACKLCKTRTNAVPGNGVKNPSVMIIGNNPDIEEDTSGSYFEGLAGERLNKMLNPIGLSLDSNCFVTGVVKCRTPDKREPMPEETTSCADFLHRQILVLNPQIILCTGLIAAQSLLRSSDDINELRGKILKLRIDDIIIPVIVTYHPNEVWDNQELKRPAWEDLKKLKVWLDTGN